MKTVSIQLGEQSNDRSYFFSATNNVFKNYSLLLMKSQHESEYSVEKITEEISRILQNSPAKYEIWAFESIYESDSQVARHYKGARRSLFNRNRQVEGSWHLGSKTHSNGEICWYGIYKLDNDQANQHLKSLHFFNESIRIHSLILLSKAGLEFKSVCEEVFFSAFSNDVFPKKDEFYKILEALNQRKDVILVVGDGTEFTGCQLAAFIPKN